MWALAALGRGSNSGTAAAKRRVSARFGSSVGGRSGGINASGTGGLRFRRISAENEIGCQHPCFLNDVMSQIFLGNEVGHLPPLNIKGYLLGNPLTDVLYDLNSRVVFAHRKALISNEIYESAKNNCKGEYMHVDPENVDCGVDLQSVVKCIEKIFNAHILEPKCGTLNPTPNFLKWDRRILGDGGSEINPLALLESPGPWCRNYDYLYCYVWANDKTVQKALHIREGTKTEWIRCNESSSYAHDVIKSTDYHQNLTEKKLRALIYSGDHDMVVPYIGTMAWIETLNLSLSTDWEAWFVDGQVAGLVCLQTHVYARFSAVLDQTSPEICITKYVQLAHFLLLLSV
ncbi:serine carboxypeptidase-like 18 [Eucalyptus grandis]|uniref:serine carboxypeptidase-like 18 n=1 Tax=Eucalyptus grandis TaxID=71139 RepID=UPI00192EE1B7|nr:serine carboxypeptidase-like 18 [Eucalyptus grandis]